MVEPSAHRLPAASKVNPALLLVMAATPVAGMPVAASADGGNASMAAVPLPLLSHSRLLVAMSVWLTVTETVCPASTQVSITLVKEGS